MTAKESEKRVALIRVSNDEPRAFSTSSVIVMKFREKNGYILKKNMQDKDENGHLINVQLPGKDHLELNLGKVELKQKYSKEIKITDEKMKDLSDMRTILDKAGDWIEELAKRQKSEALCQEPSEEECDYSIFEKNTWGADNSMQREKVKKIENPAHALNGNKEKELETPELDVNQKAPKQNDFAYSVQKTGEKLSPIIELVEKFEKKKKQLKK